MTKHTSRALVLALMAGLVAAPAAAQSVLLRVSPDNGLVSKYLMNMEMNVEAPGAPAGGPMLTSSIFMTQTVTGIEGDVVEYTMLTDSSQMGGAAMAMMQGQIPDPTGETQVVRMDSRGRNVGVEAPDAEPGVQELLGELGGFSFEFPEGEVSPGDTWTAELDAGAPGMPGGGSMSVVMSLTYTLASVASEGGSQLATVTFEGPVSLSADAGGMMLQGTGTNSGSFVFDVTNSRMSNAESSMSISLDLGGAGMMMSQSVSTSMRLIG